MNHRKTLIRKLKSQNRKQRNLLKLCSPAATKKYLESIKIFKEEIERLEDKNKTLKKEVFKFRAREEVFKKKGFFKKLWEVIKNV